MRLIFIEGVSGVGKTTLVQKLSNKLNEMGYATKYYLEFDFTNPVDFYCTAYFKEEEYKNLLVDFPEYSDDIKSNTIIAGDIRLIRYYNGEIPLFTEPLRGVLRKHEFCHEPGNPVPLPEYTRVYKLVWEMLAQETSNQFDFLIFDGSLLHHPINDLIRNYKALFDQVANHVNSLVESVTPLRPQVFYLSSKNIARTLKKAHICRKQTPPSAKQIQFWEERSQIDLAVLQQLAIPYEIYDISHENWDSYTEQMINRILETDDERTARIYPVILSEYNPDWPKWYAKEKANLETLIGKKNIVSVNHYGSTSVPGLMAKPTIDILVEIHESTDIQKLIASLPSEYIALDEKALTLPMPPPQLLLLKGYLANGFAPKVFHIHVRYPGEWDELRFRDYLMSHPDAVAEYADLKHKLIQEHEHDRDGYTKAKTAFIHSVTVKARKKKEDQNGN
ncbi:MAG: GrpB family protein [Clostridia bacterium]